MDPGFRWDDETRDSPSSGTLASDDPLDRGAPCARIVQPFRFFRTYEGPRTTDHPGFNKA
jgi:hypothetical protein